MAKFYPTAILTIDAKEVYSLSGLDINTKMKQLSSTVGDENTSITQVIETTNVPIESTPIEYITDDNYSSYMWFDSGTIYVHNNNLMFIMNRNMGSLFYNLKNLTNVQLNSWGNKFNVVLYASNMFKNTSIVDVNTIMQNWNFDSVLVADSMFEDCREITTINFTNIHIGENIVNMNRFFCNATKLASVNWTIVRSTDDTNILSVADMFLNCPLLENVYINGVVMPISFSSSPLLTETSIRYILGNSKAIVKPPGGILNFEGCVGINTIFNDETEAIAAMNNGWTILPKLTGPAYLASGAVFNAALNKQMVSFTKSQTETNKPVQDISLNQDASIVTWFDTDTLVQYYYCESDKIYLNPDCSSMFKDCSALQSISTELFDIKHPLFNLSHMFENCSALDTLSVSNLVTTSVIDTSYMFANCSSLTALSVANFKTTTVLNMEGMFKGMSSVTTLTTNVFQLNVCENLSRMYEGCSSLTTLNPPISCIKFNTLYKFLSGCSSLTSINLVNFTSTFLTNTSYLFENCSSLTTILNMDRVKTSNVTDMSYMFYGCSSIATLNITTFDVSNVVNMSNLFNNCIALETLTNFPAAFNTSNVTDMSYMFANTIKLRNPYLNYFNTSKVTNMRYMFANGSKGGTSVSYGANFTNLGMDQQLFKYDSELNPTYKMYENTGANRPTSTTWAIGTFISETGTYCSPEVLVAGNTFNSAINKNMVHFVFSPTDPEATVVISDISKDQNGNIKTWYDDVTETQYVYTKYEYIYLNEDCSNMFKDCTHVETIDTSKFLSKNVTNMNSMFRNCSALVELDLSTIDALKVTDMGYMFDGCTSLTNIITTALFQTNNVKTMNSMFRNCSGFQTISLVSQVYFRSNNLLDMGFMFSGCTGLTSLVLGTSFQVITTEIMNNAFENCSSLTSLNLNSWRTNRAYQMNSMFFGCSSLTSITFNTTYFVNQNIRNISSNSIINGSYNMYKNCPANKPAWSGGNWDSESGTFVENPIYLVIAANIAAAINTTAVSFMRSETPSWGTVTDISKDQNKTIITWMDTNTRIQYWYSSRQEVYIQAAGGGLFYGKSTLKTINIVGWNSSMVTSLATMFYGCLALETITMNLDTYNVTNMSNMFQNCYALTSVDFSNFNTSNVTNLNGMFRDCRAITHVNLSSFNTSKVTTLANMFYDCYALSTVNLSSFDTSNVTDMAWMFAFSGITTLDLSNFNTPKLVSLYSTFNICSRLTSINLSSFDTSNVTTLQNMFNNCNSLISLDLSNFDTSNVTNLQTTFQQCNSLTTLNISNFDTSKLSTMTWTFTGCINLTTIIYGDNFVRSESLGNLTVANSANRTYEAFKNVPGNKPDWPNGNWNASGTFVATS